MSNEVIGYGKSPIGTVVHAILDGGLGLCDRRRLKTLVVDKNATADSVNCAKCSTYTVVKEARKPPPATGLPSHPKAKAKAKLEPKPKPKPKEKAEPKKAVEEYDWVAQKGKGDSFNIYHRPSKRKFFENIPGEVIDQAVLNMNGFTLRWVDPASPIPNNLVSMCRKALAEAYTSVGIAPPKAFVDDKPKRKAKRKVEPKTKTRKFKKGDELDLNGVPMIYDGEQWQKKKVDVDFVEKPKRVIKRRAKKEDVEAEKRVIKRRKPKEKPTRKIRRRKKVPAEELNRFGMKPNLPPAAIVEALDGDGSTFNELVDMLVDRFDMAERRAKAKIKGIVNKLARKKSAEIVVVLAENEGDDYFSFLDAWK